MWKSDSQIVRVAPHFRPLAAPVTDGGVFSAACSGVYAEGQQFVRVQVVEGAQVGQAQEQLGEHCAVVGATARHERAQGPDQALLQLLQGTHVLDACTVCRKGQKEERRNTWLFI